MKVESLACDNCGASLEVPEKANYVTCNYCSTQLRIHREESVTFSEVVEKLKKRTAKVEKRTAEVEERTEEVEDQLALLKIERELDQIDRDWERERDGLMLKNKNGQKTVPTVTQGYVAGGVMSVMGIFISVVAPEGVGFMGLVMIPAGLAWGYYVYHRAQLYERALALYVERRLIVERRVKALKK